MSITAAILFSFAGLGLVISDMDVAHAAPNANNTHVKTTIQIAPGMEYTWTPIWTSGLNVTTTIYSEELNNNTVNYATITGSAVKVTIDPNAKSGDVYNLMIKGTAPPTQEYYVPIEFQITSNLNATVSKHQDIVAGDSITLSPNATGMGNLTWSFTDGKSPVSGLTIDSSTGKVTGSPAGMGIITVYITVASDIGERKNIETSFEIFPSLTITNDPAKGAIIYVLS